MNEKSNLITELKNWTEEDKNPVIRKMGFLYMAHNMNESDLVQLRQLFLKIDKNKNGQIHASELKEYFEENKNS
jgi:Ca2+-binding EF-hand superfamily protein